MADSNRMEIRRAELYTLTYTELHEIVSGNCAFALHREPEMIWLTDGKILFTVDGTATPMSQGDMLFINPFESHEGTLLPDFPNATFYSLIFDSDKLLQFPCKQLADRLTAVFTGKKVYPRFFPAGENQKMQEILAELVATENADNTPLLAADIFRLFALLGIPSDPGTSTHQTQTDRFLKEVLDYIGRINPSQITLENIAAHFNYSKNYYSQLFHRLVGTSVSDFCTQYKINRAQSLICDGNHNLTEVCEFSGFNHYTFFFRTFRRIVGMSPSEFIRKCEIEPDFRRNELLEETAIKKEKHMNIQSRILPALVKVFENEDPPSEPECLKMTALRGEHTSFQIAYLSDETGDVRIHAMVPAPLTVSVRTVEYIPSEYIGYPEQMELDRNYLTPKSGKFPDCLRVPENETVKLKKKKYKTVWIETEIPADAPAGDYEICVRLSDNAGTPLTDDKQNITVLSVEMPQQKLVHTEWFYADCIADVYGYEVFSPAHWAAIDHFMKTAAHRGINMIYTPLFTPSNDTAPGCDRTTTQLVGVRLDGDTYSFDFTLLERWIAMAQSAGMKWFEMVHFSAPGAGKALKVMATVDGMEQQIFSMDVTLPDNGYARFLNAFLPALRQELETLGILDHCYFHIADEPSATSLPNYLWMKRLVGPHLAGCKIIDAVSVPAFVEQGLTDIPVPETKHFAPFDAMNLPERWTYYCCSCGVDLSNRFFAMRLARTRALGIQLFKYRMDGFLHWGYNFYNSCGSIRHLNPYQYSASSNDGGNPQYKAFPSGDAFLVYPGANGIPEESIRLLALEEGMKDLTLLHALAEKTSYEAVVAVMEEDLDSPITFFDYPTSDFYYTRLRNHINRELARLA